MKKMKGGKFYKNEGGVIYYVFNDRVNEHFVEAYAITEGLDFISRVKVSYTTLTELTQHEENEILEQINFNDLFYNT